MSRAPRRHARYSGRRRACSTCCRPSRRAGSRSSLGSPTGPPGRDTGLLLTPIVEHYEVFQRVGESTDVVRKEMYEFVDRGGRHLALRPEGTAPVVRAFVQHRPDHAVEGVVPRAELPRRTAAGRPVPPALAARRRGHRRRRSRRRRRGHGVAARLLFAISGCTACGCSSTRWATPRAAAVIATCCSSTGGRTPSCSAARWNAPRRTRCASSTPSATTGSSCLEHAPQLGEYLTDDAAAHFARVQQGLRALGIAFEIAPRLVRGFDYYTRTVFEFQSDALDAAQNAIGGGGRYDRLAEELGGPPAPSIGFGAGIERLLLACDAEGRAARADGAGRRVRDRRGRRGRVRRDPAPAAGGPRAAGSAPTARTAIVP